MQAALAGVRDWTRAVIFDSSCNVLASTADIAQSDLAVFASAFNDRDTTVGAGLTINGVNYEVHRFYHEEGLVYGRIPSVDPRDGEGICLARARQSSSGQTIFAVITYKFPNLSSKAVPDLQAFLKEWVESK